MTETTYLYSAITAATEKKMKQYIRDALKEPEKVKGYRSAFGATFTLWFEITRDDPQQNHDGPRLMELALEFPDTAAELAAYDAAD